MDHKLSSNMDIDINLASLQKEIDLLATEEERTQKEVERKTKKKFALEKSAFSAFSKELPNLKSGSFVFRRIVPFVWQLQKVEAISMIVKKDENTETEPLRGKILFEDQRITKPKTFYNYSGIRDAFFFPILDENVEETQKLIRCLHEDDDVVLFVPPSRKRKCICTCTE